MAQGDYKLRITADAKQFAGETRSVINELNNALPSSVAGIFGRISSFAASPVGAIAAIAGAVAGMFQSAVNDAAKLRKMAAGAELTSRQSQAIELAAKRGGIEPESLLLELEIIKQRQGELAQGNKELAKSFELLGFSEEQALTADPYDVLLKIFDATKKGEGGVKAFSAAVNILGRSFRSELAPLARRGLGDWIKEYADSNLVIADETIKKLADIKAQENRIKSELEARAEKAKLEGTGFLASIWGFVRHPLASFGAAQNEAFRRGYGAPSETEFEDQQSREEKRRRLAERAGDLQRERDLEVNKQADAARIENEEKIRRYQFDGLSAAEKRKAIEQEIARITFDLEHDKLKNELEVQQARSRLTDLKHFGAEARPSASLQPPGEFSRMGLYLSSGAETYAHIYGLQNQQLKKLDAIKSSIDALPGKLSAEQ